MNILKNRILSIVNSERTSFYAPFCAFLTILIIFIIMPAFLVVKWSVLEAGTHLNFSGYIALFKSDDFLKSLNVTFRYVFFTVLLQILIGSLAAILVYQLKKFRWIISLIIFLPYTIPSIVVYVMWSFMIKTNGILTIIFGRLFNTQKDFFISDMGFYVLVLVSVWQFYPFVYITLLAKLRRISPVYYKSAASDGASKIKQLLFITLPQIKLTLFVLCGLRIVFMFTKFDTPFLFGANTANRELVSTVPIFVDEKIADGYSKLVGNVGIAAAVTVAFSLGVFFLLIHLTTTLWKRFR